MLLPKLEGFKVISPQLFVRRVCRQGDEDPQITLSFIGHFPQKSPIISGSFAKNDLQFETNMQTYEGEHAYVDECAYVDDYVYAEKYTDT